MVSVPDFIYSFLFLVVLMHYRYLSCAVANRHSVGFPTPGDFTVQVKGFQSEQVQNVKDFFGKQNGFLRVIEARSGAVEQIRCLFVTFQTKAHKDAILQDYKPRCCRSYKSQKAHLMVDGHPIYVKQAPQPNDVIWKNINKAKWTKRMRKIAASVIAGLLMTLSAVLLFTMRDNIAGIPSKESCHTYGTPIPTPGNDLKQDDNKVLCWCDAKSYEDALNYPICDTYISLLFESYTETAGASFSIIVINIAIEYLLHLLVRFEKSMNNAHVKTRTMVELFIFMYLNTAFLIIFINTDFSLVQTKYDIPLGSITKNGISDFNRDWYITVGQIYQLTMVFSMFYPHVGTVVYAAVASCCRKRMWEKSQSDLNKRFTSPIFNLSGRLAVLLTFVFSCFLLSGGIPLLNVICALGLGMIHVSEKFLLLKRYQVPSEFDPMLNDRVQALLPLCVALHCVFSMYLYGAEDIFGTQKDETTMWLYNRMSTGTGITCLVFAGVAVSMTLASPALNRCMRKWRKMNHKVDYEACKKDMYQRCPYSYDIASKTKEHVMNEEREEINSMAVEY